MSGINKIGRAITLLNAFLGHVSYALIALQAGFVVVAIFLRYVLNSPLKSATEIGVIIMVFVAFMGCAYGLQVGGHIHVEIFIDRLRPKVRDLIVGINYILFGLPYCAVLFYFCFLFVQSSYEINEHTQGAYILLWPIKSMFLVGFTLLALQFIVSGIDRIYSSISRSSSYSLAK